jgi:hypothetical protein
MLASGNQGLFVHFPKKIRVRSAAVASPLQRIDENLQPVMKTDLFHADVPPGSDIFQ